MMETNAAPETRKLRGWEANNPDKVKASKRAYYQRHKDRIRAEQAARRAANPELWRARNRETYRKRQLREPEWEMCRARFRRYGITKAQYLAMVTSQEGRCAICQREPETFHIDHDHRSGDVRGLLCFSCNTALGHLGDDPNICERAATYLVAAMKRTLADAS